MKSDAVSLVREYVPIVVLVVGFIIILIAMVAMFVTDMSFESIAKIMLSGIFVCFGGLLWIGIRISDANRNQLKSNSK